MPAPKKTPAQLATEKMLREGTFTGASVIKTAPGIALPKQAALAPGTAVKTSAYVAPKTTTTAKAPAPAPAAPVVAPVQAAKTAAVKQYVDTGYVPGANVTSAYDAYQQQLAAKPADYQSQYDAQIAAAFDKIMNRDKFSYDMNGDILYQQMKDRYLQQGNMAMQDTMGQAAALTGGYGNSWAQTAGQQAYGQHLQALNDQVPALMDRAYQQYADEGSEMYNQLNTMRGLEADDYGQYRDQVVDWQTMLGMKQDAYQDERGFDYGKFADQRQYDFSQAQWEYKKQQDAAALALAQQKAAGSSSSRGGTTPAWKQLGFASYKAYQEYMEERLRQEQEAEQAKYIKQYVTHSKTFGAGM